MTIPADSQTAKKGFTIIEVMLVLALTGLLIVGMLGGTFTAIASQRYNDSVRSFAEYLRTIYGEVMSPESFGEGNSMKEAVFGKVLVFGYPYSDVDDARAVYSATIVGDANIPLSISGGFMDELKNQQAKLYCGSASSLSTQDYYRPLWEAELTTANDASKRFTGTVIIGRSPTSGTVHTYFSENKTYDLRDGCTGASQSASAAFAADIQSGGGFQNTTDIGFCVKSTNARIFREVRIAADGRNTSAISILDVDPSTPGEVNRCL